MKIPSVDLPAQYAGLRKEIHAALDRVMARGDAVLGEAVTRFEAAFARSCGAAYGIGVNSGTDALSLSLAGLGIGAGDEVITTAYTFFATASAITHCGARPVPVDIDPVTYNLDPDRVEQAITRRTKALVVVHLFGQPAQMDRLCAIARRRRLALVEDCAQAHGARFQGRHVGTFGQAGAFSFYPTKNLSALGDAGMVVTDSRALQHRVRLLRDHGRNGKYRHPLIGRNSRLDTFQAAVLDAKLSRLAAWNRTRARLAQHYAERLRRLAPAVMIPHRAPGRDHVYHLYVVRVRSRDRVLRMLQARGVQALVHYPVPFYLQPAFRWLGCRRGSFPHAERLAREAISLPIYPEMRPDQVARVARELAQAVRAA